MVRKFDYPIEFKAPGEFRQKRDEIAAYVPFKNADLDRLIYKTRIQAIDPMVSGDVSPDEPSLEIQTLIDKMTPEQRAKLRIYLDK